jgi:hypothetical protein
MAGTCHRPTYNPNVNFLLPQPQGPPIEVPQVPDVTEESPPAEPRVHDHAVDHNNDAPKQDPPADMPPQVTPPAPPPSPPTQEPTPQVPPPTQDPPQGNVIESLNAREITHFDDDQYQVIEFVS